MPQPSTQRPVLDSFLPQFAATSDDQISPGMIPNGEHRDAIAAPPANRVNGHSAAIEADELTEQFHEQSELVHAGSQNGTAGHALLDTPDAPGPASLNGNGAAHHNGIAAIESAINGAVSDVLASTVASESHAAELSPHAEVEIGEPPLLAPAVESSSHAEPIHQPEEAQSLPASGPLPEHPAVGSLFTPYLVTEIRELRNRSKRRSWWRRLFG